MTTTMNAKISSERALAGRDRAEVHPGQRAGQRGRGAADGEHERERLAHVDAERGDHRPVLDPGPDHQADAGVAEEGEQRQQHHAGAADQQQARRSGTLAPPIEVTWRRPLADAGTAAASAPQIACSSATPASDSPTVTSTCSMVRAVERPDQHQLDQRRRPPRRPHAERRPRAGSPSRRAGAGHAPAAHQVAYAPDRQEQPVREVEHVGQAEHQREPGRDQEVQPGQARGRCSSEQHDGAHRQAPPSRG